MTREEELQKIKDNSPYSLPDNPSESGWTAGQIKEKFWKGLFVLYDIINADRDELQTKLEQIDDAIDDFAGIAGVVAKARGDEDGVNLKQNYAKTAALVDGTIACLKYIKENGESGNIKDIEAAVTSVRTSLDAFIADKFTGEKAKKAIQADSAEIATKDVDGNPIKTTYAKQSSLDALLSMITAIGNGSSTVDKARKDQDGNRIDLTYIKKSNIVNDLNHDDVDLPLSAKQGKVLKEMAQGFISSTGDNVFGGNNSFTGTNTFNGVLNPNSNGKGLVMPDTSGYSADKTIATADKFDDYRTAAAQDVIDQATRDIAEGKTKAFSVDPTTTGNEALQSDNKTITLTSFEDVDGNTITVSELHKGDEIFTVNGVNVTYKDRWLMDPANGTWGLLDADLPDLTNAASLSGNNTFTGDNTFSGKLNKNGSGFGFTLPSSASLGANSEIIDTASTQTITGTKTFDIVKANTIYISSNDAYTYINKTAGNLFLCSVGGDIIASGNIRSNSDGQKDIGSSSYKWRHLYLSGQFKDGNNATYGLILPDSTNWTANKTIAIAENTVDLYSNQTITGQKTFSNGFNTQRINNNGQIFVFLFNQAKYSLDNSNFRSIGDLDLGISSNKWKDLYLSGKIIDGTNEFNADNVFNVINASDITNNTLTQAQYDLITNGKPTLIKGTLFGFKNILLMGVNEPSFGEYSFVALINYLLAPQLRTFRLLVSSRVLSLNSATSKNIRLQSIAQINEKILPDYPSDTTKQYKFVQKVGGNLDYVEDTGGTEVEANPTVPSGTTPTDLTNIKVGSNYYKIPSELPSAIGTAGQVLKVNANAGGVEWGNMLFKHKITVTTSDGDLTAYYYSYYSLSSRNLTITKLLQLSNKYSLVFSMPSSMATNLGVKRFVMIDDAEDTEDPDLSVRYPLTLCSVYSNDTCTAYVYATQITGNILRDIFDTVVTEQNDADY